MITLPLVVIAGLLGSSHCIGMCGPFALMIGGSAKNWRRSLQRQVFYTAGRVFTYATLGGVAGAAGLHLARRVPSFVNVAALLAILAGGFLVFQGLRSAGIFVRRDAIKPGGASACFAFGFIGQFLRSPSPWAVFSAGLFTGLLPCGLVYGFLALAASSESVWYGAVMMSAFGAGTAPVMIATGSGAVLLGPATRQRLFWLAAWCVVITGLLSIGRGIGFIEVPGWFTANGCPICQPR